MNFIYVVWSPHYGVDMVTADRYQAHTHCENLNQCFSGLDYRVERKVLQQGGVD